MRTNRKAGLLILLAIVMLTITSYTDVSETDAAGAGIYWGAHLYGKPPEAASFQPGGLISNFETNIAQKKMSIIAWGAPWEYPVGSVLWFQTAYFDNVRAHGAIPMLDWGSWACCGLTATQPAYQLSYIANGTYDGFITTWAKQAKAWGHSFFLRFNWEMNGNWQFPWSSQLNNNTPDLYVKAWRRVHDIFNKVGATNVTWVWAPNISTWNTVPLAKLYPGSSYVDWVGLDGYNWAGYQGMPWEMFSQVYSGDTKLVSNSKDSYTEITTVAAGKPLMITEFASVEAGDGGGAKSYWIADALGNSVINKYPKIKAIVWFNWDAGAGLSWPVESSAASMNAFRTGISPAIYLTNIFANLGNGKIQARR